VESEIRKSEPKDLSALMEIFEEARKTIRALGIDQWQNGYPNPEVISEDMEKDQSYVITAEGRAVATFAVLTDGEPTYDVIYGGAWKTGDAAHTEYLAIHRVAISVACRGQGISTKIIRYAEEYARSLGRKSLRIDTHEGNLPMRRMLEKHGFIHCGTILLENGDPRVAYEYVIQK
jgi:GNAT superfamily N-acetyltransferase